MVIVFILIVFVAFIILTILGRRGMRKKSALIMQSILLKCKNIPHFRESRRVVISFQSEYVFLVDEAGKKLCLIMENQTTVFDFKDIIGYEILIK